ncbi:MAG: hypothetical protein H7Y20_12155 [Bryobacteraceae bacterium]|nr:hypothetical protein [Bryobacteraceae bacterium]
MFETEVDTGPSLAVVLLQTAGVIPFSILMGFLTCWIPSAISDMSSPAAVIPEGICILAFAGGVPYLIARIIAVRYPSLVSAGQLVGLIPAFVFVPLTILSKGEILAPRVQGAAGIVWLLVVLITYPALGCMGYSLGMISIGRKAALRLTDV